jgi:hypothetical protein
MSISIYSTTPRHIPRMFELWKQYGLDARARIKYHHVMCWFFKVCGMKIPPVQFYETFPAEYMIQW